MKRKKYKRIISIVSIVTMLFSMFVFRTLAYETITESQSNDTVETADITQDDYNNYGTISNSTDVDWWKITFQETGLVNIWMGQVPAGCNYDLYLYESDGECEIARSTKTSNSQEFMRVRVYSGIPIYLKVVSSGGYSSTSQYLLRFKRYDFGQATIYTFNDSYISSISSRPSFLSNYSDAGYTTRSYVNQSVDNGYSTLPNSQIYTIHGDGNNGELLFYNGASHLIAQGSSTLNYKTIASYPANALASVNLLLFAGDFTGLTSNSYGNLVDMALSKNAKCCIGWLGTDAPEEYTKWLSEFTAQTTYYSTIRTSIDMTNSWIEDEMAVGSTIRDVYYGASLLDSYVL